MIHNTYIELNRLLTILSRALPVYLKNTTPWIKPGQEDSLALLRRIADDQEQMAGRVFDFTNEHYGPPEVGEFPIDYFDTHDLSLEFLLKKLVRGQHNDVRALESVVKDLENDRQAMLLAEEALGAARGHAETLEELSAGRVPPSLTIAAHDDDHAAPASHGHGHGH